MRKVVFLFFIFLLNLVALNAADVSVEVDIFSEYSLFNYEFKFNPDESYRSFSFEKPKDAKVDFVKSGDGESVKYSIAGDYLIVNPKTARNQSFNIRFVSKGVSTMIFEKNTFEIYSNFNFIVDNFDFNLELKEDVGEISTFYPREYIVLNDGSFQWNLKNLEKEELFRLEFSDVDSIDEVVNGNFRNENTIIIVSGVILLSTLVILVFMFVFSNRFKNFSFSLNFGKKDKVNSKGELKKKVVSEVKLKPVESVDVVESIDADTSDIDLSDDSEIVVIKKDDVSSEIVRDGINEEEYREVMAKFLTDNEKLVVDCVKTNDGISQFDILNFLPSLTKSNLSKIISKLDNKKILKRIRVGKVNKIYLGSRFNLE